MGGVLEKNKNGRSINKEKESGPSGKPWATSEAEILKELEVSADQGLSEIEIKKRRKKFGLNRIQAVKKKSAFQILIDQFKNLIVLLLAGAAFLAYGFGEVIDAIAIMAVLFINGGIGFWTELRAVRSMDALRRKGSVKTKVLRNGTHQIIPAERLVPGDIVLLEGGDVAAADLRLIESSKLQADESALTGESDPIDKQVKLLDKDIPLADRKNILFKGTAVTRGSGKGVVVAIGMDTELGHITSLVEEAKGEQTPLEKRLDRLGFKLIWATLGFAVLVAVSGILTGKDIFLMVETAIALAVATIPEGLPIVATVALARGMWRMAHRNALINRLSAVETLGATGVIFTDKTGTLTENRMTVRRIVTESDDTQVGGEGLSLDGEFTKDEEPVKPDSDPLLREVLEIGVLCNNASLEKTDTDQIISNGDPIEVAMLIAGKKAKIDYKKLFEDFPREHEEAFDPSIKMMATFHKISDEYRVMVKGAPEAVLDACSRIMTRDKERKLEDKDRRGWVEENERLAKEGLRILAVATKKVQSSKIKPYQDLVFVGLVGLLDPPRKDVQEAIASCREAGIRVVMVTGDQPFTARAVGEAVGLTDKQNVEVMQGKDLKDFESLSEDDRKRLLHIPIFSRVDPKQKLDLITVYQKAGSIVAMTGDGVNDAPALKKADIGVAMGKRGTQVAREAADMVLKDDAFGTIVVAVEMGRSIFDNIRKFVLYLLSCNISEVLVVVIAALVQSPLPLLPLQILYLNLVTDVFPALALGVGKGDPAIMKRHPRNPKEPILTRNDWMRMGVFGFLITASVLSAFAFSLISFEKEVKKAVTISFLTLAFAQLWHVFNMRSPKSGLLKNEISENKFIWGALILCVSLLLFAVYLPGLSSVLKVVNPGLYGWAIIILMSLVPFFIGQTWLFFGAKREEK